MLKSLTPVRAIRHKCLECQGRHYRAIRDCTDTGCALHSYRLGTNPRRGSCPMPRIARMPQDGRSQAGESIGA
jgi:hypothetical protein